MVNLLSLIYSLVCRSKSATELMLHVVYYWTKNKISMPMVNHLTDPYKCLHFSGVTDMFGLDFVRSLKIRLFRHLIRAKSIEL